MDHLLRRRAPFAVPLPRVLLSAALLAAAAPAPPARSCGPLFQRADSDSSGKLEITDAVLTLSWIFLGGKEPPCLQSADANDDNAINIADPIFLLNYLFLGGPDPPHPHGECGYDFDDGGFGCREYPPCGWTELDRVFGRLGTIDTLAGSGAVGEGLNGWQEGFEGGPAVEADLSAPHIALGDGEGRIYVADKEAHAVRRVDPDGSIHTVAGMNAPGDDGDEPGPGTERHLDEPNGLWVREDGTLFILDTGNEKVRRLSPEGELSTLFAVPGLRTGRGLWVSEPEDLAYVSSRQTLARWTPEGGIEAYATGFEQLGNLAVDPEGNVIVTDRDAHRVYRVDLDRNVIPIAGNGTTSGGGDGMPGLETGLNQVRGVWIHPEGGLLLGTQAGSQVWYLDTKGIIHLLVDGAPGNLHAGDGESYDAPGPKISNVRAVTMDVWRNLLIVENDFGYVRIVEYLDPPPCG